MKTQGLRIVTATSIAAALLFLIGGVVAHAGDRGPILLSIDFDNFYPTPQDEIVMTISYALPDGCYDVDEGQPEQPDDMTVLVSIEANEVPGPCPGPTDRTIHRVIGPLTTGTYDIGAEVNVDYLCQGLICEGESLGISTMINVATAGDANCDGAVNSIDANRVLQQSAALSDAPCPQGADADQDGSVTSIDATLILQYNAGLLTQLPPA